MASPSSPPRLLLCCPSCKMARLLVGNDALDTMTVALRLQVYCAEADVRVLRQQLAAANAVCERLVKEKEAQA